MYLKITYDNYDESGDISRFRFKGLIRLPSCSLNQRLSYFNPVESSIQKYWQ